MPPAHRMITRVLLVLGVAALAACGEGAGGVARVEGKARFDTAAGYRLGMLLPEARAAAAARGDELRCELATATQDPSHYPDSIWRSMTQMELCDPANDPYSYNLQFQQGSLRAIILTMSEDWDMIPADTLEGRLTKAYGKPWKRMTYSTGSGRAEELISWSRKGDPATLGLRCPDGATAGSCTLEYRLFPPEPRAKGR
jgi:hypothetical protein